MDIASFLEFLKEHWAPLTVLAIFAIGFLVLLISFIVSEAKQKSYAAALAEQTSSTRIFIVDLKESSAVYFNANSPSRVRKITLAEFYSHFASDNQKELINWVNALCDQSANVPDSLETDVYDAKAHRTYFSMLQKESVDPVRRVIHLRSYLFKYMPSNRSSGGGNHGVVKTEELTHTLDSHSAKRGVVVAYRFRYKNPANAEKEIQPLTMNQIKNALAPVVPKGCFAQIDGNELVTADLKVSERNKANFFASSGLAAVNRYLSLHDLDSSIAVSAGFVERYVFGGKGEEVLSKADEMARKAENEEATKPVRFSGVSALNESDDIGALSVSLVISQKKFSFSFRPIYGVSEKTTVGYFLDTKPVDSPWTSLTDLQNAARNQNLGTELFSAESNGALSRFYAEAHKEEGIAVATGKNMLGGVVVPASKPASEASVDTLCPIPIKPTSTTSFPYVKDALFYPTTLMDKDLLFKNMPRLLRKYRMPLVLLFSQQDLMNNLKTMNTPGGYTIEGFRSMITGLKGKGFNVGLLVSGELEPRLQSLFESFDAFVVAFSPEDSSTDVNSRLRAKLHSLVEKLLKYNRPIIATDLPGWPAVGLVAQSLMASELKDVFLSSDVIAPYDQELRPIGDKPLRRLQSYQK